MKKLSRWLVTFKEKNEKNAIFREIYARKFGGFK